MIEKNKVAFFDFGNTLTDPFKLSFDSFEDLTVKPKESYWKVSKVTTDKNVVIRKEDKDEYKE